MRTFWGKTLGWTVMIAGMAALFVVVVQDCEAKDAAYRDWYGRIRAQKKGQPAPVVVPIQPAQGIFDGTLRKKLLLAVVKHRTIDTMVKEGVKGKKYTRAEAEAAYDKLGDDVIAGAVAEASPAAQGQLVGGRLTDFLQWLADHQDQIMAIVKMILSILALFG